MPSIKFCKEYVYSDCRCISARKALNHASNSWQVQQTTQAEILFLDLFRLELEALSDIYTFGEPSSPADPSQCQYLLKSVHGDLLGRYH